MNKKLLFVSLSRACWACWATACAVEPSSAPTAVERAASYASASGTAVMPKLTPWDGKPLPPTQSPLATVFIVASTFDAGHSWGIETDGDHVAAWVDLDSSAVGSLVQVMVDPHALPLELNDLSLLPTLKIPTPQPPRNVDALYYLMLAADVRTALDHAAGACCAVPPGK